MPPTSRPAALPSADEARYRALVEAAAQLVWVADPAGRLVEPQPQWEEYTGQTFEHYRGAGWLDALHPDDRERTAEAWARAVERRARFEVEYRVRRRDGVYRRFVVRGVPVLDAAGNVREWVGMETDVTEQREAEARVHASEARLRAAFEQSPVPTVIYDARGRVRAANPAFERLWNTRAADVPESYSVLDDPQLEATGMLPLLRRAFGLDGARTPEGEGETVSVPAIRYDVAGVTGRGRTLWVEGHLYPVRDAEGRVAQVVLTHRDVTAQRDAEEALAAAREEAEAARRRMLDAFDSITDPFFTVDRDWKLTYLNPAVERVVGRPRESLVGKDLWAEFSEAVGTPFYAYSATTLRERFGRVVGTSPQSYRRTFRQRVPA